MFTCSNCNKVCKNKGGLTKHKNVCKEENRKICPYCKYEFNTVQNCKRHLEDNNCLEYKKILDEEKNSKIKEYENEIKKLEKQLSIKNNIINELEIKQEKDHVEFKNEKEKLLIKIDLITEHKDELIKQIERIEPTIETNKILAGKVGNKYINSNNNNNSNNGTNNLFFDVQAIGQMIEKIELTNDTDLIKIGKLFADTVHNISGAYISDQNRKTITYNDKNKNEVKDQQGKLMSKVWITEEKTVSKLNEWGEIIEQNKEQSINEKNDDEIIKYVNMSKDQKEIFKDPMKLQHEINKHLPNKYEKQLFHLSNLYESIKEVIFKSPNILLFNIRSFFYLITNNSYNFVDHKKYINYVKNNNEEYIKLNSADLIFIIKHLFNEIIIENSQLLNQHLYKAIKLELNMIKHNNKRNKNEELMENINSRFEELNNNIKWLSSDIKQDDEKITTFIDDLYNTW
jgi:hypothetical protein